ncbi:CCAAT/enhancer-binding protein gamma [Contarinia nasturtii]|uniref:CCAAT/enhancer-binding protein gamma n=1 Tax=Contarinia nasturtii TaxID=265458 RepID=UPI0012D386F8|nr:CCAAT/enhancer-binding protein gamma [Contarinia nasturtii]
MAPVKKKNAKQVSSGGSDPESEEYLKKRARNNQAVKKSRNKSKQKAEETKERVDNLKNDNQRLSERISEKEKQLNDLKSLFIETAKSKTDVVNQDLRALLADGSDDDNDNN